MQTADISNLIHSFIHFILQLILQILLMLRAPFTYALCALLARQINTSKAWPPQLFIVLPILHDYMITCRHFGLNYDPFEF